MNAKLLCWIFMYFPFKRNAAPWPVRAAAQHFLCCFKYAAEAARKPQAGLESPLWQKSRKCTILL